MKLKFITLLGTCFFLALAPTAHAWRIIRQYSYSSNDRGGIVQITPQQFDTRFKKKVPSLLPTAPAFVEGSAIPLDVWGGLCDTIPIQAGYGLHIHNATQNTQRYHYEYTLTAYMAYYNYGYEVELPPGDNFEQHVNLYGVIQPRDGGMPWYLIAAYISVMSKSEEPFFTAGNATAFIRNEHPCS